MNRVSKHTLKFATQQKKLELQHVFSAYEHDLEMYIDLILKGDLPLKTFLSTRFLPVFQLQHSQWRSICYKQASEIIRSQLKKAESKRYKRYQKVFAKAASTGRFKWFTSKKYKELKLKSILKTKYFTRPNLKDLAINLDEMVNNVELSNFFEEFIQIVTPYFQDGKKRGFKINCPIKYHKQFLKYRDGGWTRKKTIQLSQYKNGDFYIGIYWEKEEPEKKSTGESIGLDQGYKKLLSDSNGVHYGQELFNLYQKISNKKQGSKSFKRTLSFRDTEINRVINLFFKQNNNLKELFIEDLKNLKRRSKLSTSSMNKIQRWCYAQVASKLERFCQENGVSLVKVDPAYTSQTCSSCGMVDKSARNGETYSCSSCGLSIDADFNAALNIHSLGVIIPRVPKGRI